MSIPNFDSAFAQANTAAVALETSINSGVSPTDPTPVAAAPVATAPVVAPTTPTAPLESTPPVSGTPDLITVDFGGGRTEQLTRDQATARIREQHEAGLRLENYTQKTQELAREREQASLAMQQAQQLQQQLQQQAQLFQNPAYQAQMIAQWQQQNQPARDPNTPVTVGELQSILAQQQQQQGQLLQQAQQHANQLVSDKLQTADFAEKFNGTLNEVFTQHPVLKVNKQFEDIIRFEVTQLQPKSLEEAQSAARSIATKMSSELAAHFTAQQQQADANAARVLVNGGTVPSGGVAIQQQPQTFDTGKKGGQNWDAIRDVARQYMKS